MPPDAPTSPDSPAPDSPESLTPRQVRFCSFYLTASTGAEAARLAGYQDGNARTQAWRLLQDRRVRQRIEALRRERGLAALTGRERDCQDAIERALEFAAALDCPRVHVMAGIADPADPDAHATYLANLAWATGRASAAGATLTIEPINRGDMPGYFLTTADQAARVLDEVAAPDFGLQLDLYHAQATTGDAEAVLATHLPRTAHIQIAGHPGRGEPDRGTLPWTRLLDRLDRADYAGWVGCEYRPESSTAAGLSRWGAPYGLGM